MITKIMNFCDSDVKTGVQLLLTLKANFYLRVMI